MNNWDLRDVMVRVLMIVSGAIAALLLFKNGHSEALPALAIGAVLGTCVVTGLESRRDID
jgi:hypothetical protein